ncbi:MAG: POTRA domain-containing protein, partial [Melioribacteraceae bacterium]
MKIKYWLIIFFLFSIVLSAQTNKKYELSKILFEGNDAFSSSDLSTIIQSKESPNWLLQFVNKFSSIGGKAIYFDSLIVPSDINALKGFYQSKGYFKARIKSHYNLDTSNNSASLTFTITESQPAHFRSFLFKGLEWIAPEYQKTLGDYVHVDTTTVYEDAIVDEKKNYITNFLRDHGYMLVKIDRPKVVIDTMKNYVDVELHFDTGNRFKISDIKTQRSGKGADLVDDDLLKEIVGIKIGSWYSNYENQRGIVRLFRTNLFT